MGRALTLLTAFLLLLLVWFGVSPPAEPPPRLVEGDPQTPRLQSEYPGALTPETLRRIEHWLRRRTGVVDRAQPPRNVFIQTTDPEIPTTADTIRSVDDAPRLVGFVFSEGQDGETRLLAAIYFEDTMWLAETGERIGPYLVKQMIDGEEVTLLDPTSGEDLLLALN